MASTPTGNQAVDDIVALLPAAVNVDEPGEVARGVLSALVQKNSSVKIRDLRDAVIYKDVSHTTFDLALIKLEDIGEISIDLRNGIISATPKKPYPQPKITPKPRNDWERFHPNDSSGNRNSPYRDPVQIDIARVLFSPEFSRLSDVTQVVPPQGDYHFNDRSSHSLKVARVAADLARKLTYDAHQNKKFKAAGYTDAHPSRLRKWVDPHFCFVAGLTHDLGHPAFGHRGEQKLQYILTVKGKKNHIADRVTLCNIANVDKDWLAARSFEGNAQTMRIITRLSMKRPRYDQPEGLNLLLRSLAATAKYPWLHGENPAAKSHLDEKWCFYPDDVDVYNKLVEREFIQVVRSEDRVESVYRWVEAEIMDWADDICYAAHDLEDFFRADITPLSAIGEALAAIQDHPDLAHEKFNTVRDQTTKEAIRFAVLRMREFGLKKAEPRLGNKEIDNAINRALKYIINLVDFTFPRTPFTGMRGSHAVLHRFVGELTSYLMGGASLVLVHVNGKQRVQLRLHIEEQLVAEFFKALHLYYVIERSNLNALQRSQANMLVKMFEELIKMCYESIEHGWNHRNSRKLPARLREYLRDYKAGNTVPDRDIWVAVTDFVAGLSDNQAVNLATQLMGVHDVPALAGQWLDT